LQLEERGQGMSLPTVAFDHKHHAYLIASMPSDD
jgi:hypothetical protein